MMKKQTAVTLAQPRYDDTYLSIHYMDVAPLCQHSPSPWPSRKGRGE